MILAGGSGSRLWPASRQERPKQLLKIGHGEEPLIAAAVALGRKIAGDRVVIVTAEAQAEATRAVVANVELIAEPVARNTAAAIGLASAIIARRDPEATIAVLPADHHVRDREGMASALDICLRSAEQDDTIALVGIQPTRAETGFGYLKLAPGPVDDLRQVLRFVEKPDALIARRYVTDGQHLWNAGIFCMTSRRVAAELAARLPETARAVQQIAHEDGVVLDPHGLYSNVPSISFDHGVMEKIRIGVVAIAADVGWNDVGSWEALPEVRGDDGDGNTTDGQVVVIDGDGNIVVSDDGTLIATIGVSDLVVVKAGNAVLVVPKNQAQRVREVVKALAERGLQRYL